MVLEQDRLNARQATNKRPMYNEQEEEMIDSDDSSTIVSSTSK